MLALCQLDETTQQVQSCVEYTFSIIPQLSLTEATLLGVSYWFILVVASSSTALKQSFK
jgi:hypothetical protein